MQNLFKKDFVIYCYLTRFDGLVFVVVRRNTRFTQKIL